ncbi:glutaredoxin-like protein C5orf63 homolog [Argopecten irradians]|uniref:glutaredoxin-like protein C5orf63 homolog n=1 Tax=Argopecten irradians TaxID=31199 RepID=UPI0037190195
MRLRNAPSSISGSWPTRVFVLMLTCWSDLKQVPSIMLRIHRVVMSLANSGVSGHQRISMSQRSNDIPRLPVLTLYTKDDCQLCEEAKDTLIPLSHRFQLEEVDITAPSNKEWLKYCYDIPVFHFNGKYLMKHRVNLKDFERKLTEYENVHGRC